MSIADVNSPQGEVEKSRLHFQYRIVLAVFSITIFLSALLLFSIQPLFTRMVLPKLGGTSAVWSIAMVFFQAVLLLGYCYAHALTRLASAKVAAIIHFTLLTLTIFTLPIGIASGWEAPPNAGQAFWLLCLFGLSVGVPFFAVSGNGPLLQAWFARTGHPQAHDPYFLYGASNIGSFAALLSYPFLVEPLLTLSDQSWIWKCGFISLTGLIGVCAITSIWQIRHQTPSLRKPDDRTVRNNSLAESSKSRPTWLARLQWMAFAFVPSGLLVAVTTYITTDIASAPLLWVLPLALFLLTFVITFQTQPVLKHSWMLAIQPFMLAPLAITSLFAMNSSLVFLALVVFHLAAFFVNAMVCHGELVARRPQAGHLTEFYLFMSLGGVLGGVFSALIAPNLFTSVAEYPILLVLSLACHPYCRELVARVWRENSWSVFALGLMTAVFALPQLWPSPVYPFTCALAAGIVLRQFITANGQHSRWICFLVIFAGAYFLSNDSGRKTLESSRSFFGIHRIMETEDGRFRLMVHGTTIHGAERLPDVSQGTTEKPPEPLTYYYNSSPLAAAVETIRQSNGNLHSVASVGLGTGSLTCQRRQGEQWTVYEIDPEVVRLASNPKYFSFLEKCASDTKIVLGDARLKLREAPDKSYDLIILDAFSSDSIPVHLLTKEAMDMYRSKLSNNGAIVIHTSNRHMDLHAAITATAEISGLRSYLGQKLVTPVEARDFKTSSSVVLLTSQPKHKKLLEKNSFWHALNNTRGIRAWTDDYSNILGAIFSRHAN